MAAERKKRNKPNILSVSLRLVLMVLFAGAAYAVYHFSGADKPGLISLIGIGVLAACAAVILIQLIVWGLIWVKNERVSELGLHIVRYAVTLTAVSLCVFVLLSIDYVELFSATHVNELRQNAMSASIYVQDAVGEGVQDDAQYFMLVEQSMHELLLDTEENELRHACLYLKTDIESAGNSGFVPAAEGYLGLSTNEIMPCSADGEILDRVMSRFSVEYLDNIKVGTYTLMAAYSPVFSVNGEPIGVLEICEIKQIGAGVFRFATLELCLKLLALIAFFSFMFYGCMQLVDIVLRPRQFDRSRRVLSCGRESARPILFFITLSASLPIMMLLFADNVRSLLDVYQLPFGIGAYVPFIVYILGIVIGQLFGRRHRSTLSEIPADAGLVFSFLCNLALCLFMDWKKLSGLGIANNVIFMLVLFFICGLGYGIAYRITAKFQAQSDALFGYDKYVYLCSCLGAISGIVLGALVIENYSNVTLRIISCILTAFTAVIAILLLEDLKSTVKIDESCKDTLTSYAGGIVGIIPVGLACCFVWIYLTDYMYRNSISTAAIGFCAVLPVVAFCFGNRLRLKHRTAQRSTILISGIISALAFTVMALWPSFRIAVLSCVLVCVAVIFAASGIYSTTRHGELKKFTFKALPLLFVGIILMILALNIGDGMINLLITSGLCAVFMIIFLICKYPSRPVAQEQLPAITDGRPKQSTPVVVPPAVNDDPEEKADDAAQSEETSDQKEDEQEEPPVVIPISEESEPEEPQTEESEEKEASEEVEEKEDSEDKGNTEADETPIVVFPEDDSEEENASEPQEEQADEHESVPVPAESAEPEPEETSEETPAENKAEDDEEDDRLPIIFFDEPEADAPDSDVLEEASEDSSDVPDSVSDDASAAEPEAVEPSVDERLPETDTSNTAATETADSSGEAEEEISEEAAAALRAAAAQRAKENWQRYNSLSSLVDDSE